MKRKYFVWMILMGFILAASCSTGGKPDDRENSAGEKNILQQKDGTISLGIDKAACYHDNVNPSTNTAEWNVVVSKSGRYDVWLSSATMDTTDLNYKNSVLLNIRDNRFEKLPVINRVVQNSTEVSSPYYQADSFIGSLYIQDTGIYNVQVISDKILPVDYRASRPATGNDTKILAVSLTPVRH